MNKLVLACITGGWLLCGACAHHPQQPPPPPTDTLSRSDSAGDSYFPVAEILESEIRQIDTMPVAIRKFVIANGRTDSGFIKPEEFNALAMQFVLPEFGNGRFQKDFTETSFIDNATQSANFTYSTTNGELSLQRVDVVAVPQGNAHQVKSIYLERNRISGDSTILDKMFWRAGKQFKILSLIRVKGGAPVLHQLIVSWDTGTDSEADNE